MAINLTELLTEMLLIPKRQAELDKRIVELETIREWFAAQGVYPDNATLEVKREILHNAALIQTTTREQANLSLQYDSLCRVTDAMVANGLSAIFEDGGVARGYDEGTPEELQERAGERGHPVPLGWSGLPYDGSGSVIQEGGEEIGAESEEPAETRGSDEGTPRRGRRKS